LAREFGYTAQSIHNWLGKASLGTDGRPSNAAGLSSKEREELIRLRREVRRLQMERDILAKATARFANKDEKTSTLSSS
jgi:transposase